MPVCPICSKESENPATVSVDSVRRFNVESPLTILAYHADREGLGDYRFGRFTLFQAPLNPVLFRAPILRAYGICEHCIALARSDMNTIHGGMSILTVERGPVFGQVFLDREQFDDHVRSLRDWCSRHAAQQEGDYQ